MRLTNYKIEDTAGSFSMDNVIVHFGEISDKRNNRYKGIAFEGAQFGNIPVKYSFPLSATGAGKLLTFIDNVLSDGIPISVKLKLSRFLNLKWSVKKFKSEWHGGGGYKGSFTVYNFLSFNTASVTITKQTLVSMRQFIAKYYEITT